MGQQPQSAAPPREAASVNAVSSDDEFAAVLVAAGRGESWAFEQLFSELSGPLRRFASSRGVDDPDGLVNEVLVQLFASLPTFVGDRSRLAGLAFAIARRRIIDLYRRRNRRPKLLFGGDRSSLGNQPAASGTESQALDHLATDRALRALSVLTDDQRDVILLRVVADLGIRETAVALGKPETAIKALQRRGLATLRRKNLRRNGLAVSPADDFPIDDKGRHMDDDGSLSDQQVEELLAGRRAADGHDEVAAVVGSLREIRDSSASVPISAQLAEFVATRQGVADDVTGTELIVVEDQATTRRQAMFGRSGSSVGGGPMLARLAIGATVIVAGVTGAHAAGVVDVPLLPDDDDPVQFVSAAVQSPDDVVKPTEATPPSTGQSGSVSSDSGTSVSLSVSSNGDEFKIDVELSGPDVTEECQGAADALERATEPDQVAALVDSFNKACGPEIHVSVPGMGDFTFPDDLSNLFAQLDQQGLLDMFEQSGLADLFGEHGFDPEKFNLDNFNLDNFNLPGLDLSKLDLGALEAKLPELQARLKDLEGAQSLEELSDLGAEIADLLGLDLPEGFLQGN